MLSPGRALDGLPVALAPGGLLAIGAALGSGANPHAAVGELEILGKQVVANPAVYADLVV